VVFTLAAVVIALVVVLVIGAAERYRRNRNLG
jgi:hypothetical protein